MEIVEQNPVVLVVTESPDILDTLNNCKETVQKISKGLDDYIEKTLHIFPRYITKIMIQRF